MTGVGAGCLPLNLKSVVVWVCVLVVVGVLLDGGVV